MVQLLGFFSVSPAPAGMIPTITALIANQTREPRTRGDDPCRVRREYRDEA